MKEGFSACTDHASLFRRFVRMSQRIEPFPDHFPSATTDVNHRRVITQPLEHASKERPSVSFSNATRQRPVVFVIYYSTYGHVAKLASSIRTGIERAGCECRVFQVSETLPEEVLKKMHAPSKDQRVPIIRADQLAEADGFLFGMPTRFGSVPTQMKNLFDACGKHWQSDTLIGKPVNVICSAHISMTFRYFLGWRVLFNGKFRRGSRNNSTIMCPIFHSSWNALCSTRLQK